MNVEKLVENVMTKYKSSILYGLIEYAILMDEEYHAKDIDIDIIKKIIKIIDEPLSYDDIDFLEDDVKEFYDDISLELSEISSKVFGANFYFQLSQTMYIAEITGYLTQLTGKC